jgi:hypothetical protein
VSVPGVTVMPRPETHGIWLFSDIACSMSEGVTETSRAMSTGTNSRQWYHKHSSEHHVPSK